MIARVFKAGIIAAFSTALIAADEPPPVIFVPTAPEPPASEYPLDPPPPAPDYPQPPAFIADRVINKGYIYDGFDLGELEYLRGYFPEASDEERAQYAELKAWFKKCAEEGTARLNAEMAGYGVTLIEGEFSGAASMCQQVAFGNQGLLDRFETYEEFAKAARAARLVFDGLIEGLEIAEGNEAARHFRDILGEIDYFSMRYFVLLKAQFWGQTKGYGDRITFNPERPPKMTADERFIFGAFLESELVRLQFARTKWLEEIVGFHGWPNEANSTRAGAGNALLMVSQGAHDPAFQVRMLRLMEREVKSGGLEGWEFAEAYDGVMIKLTGKQRYGLYVFCSDGESALEKLEDPGMVDAWRKEIGMEPLGDFLSYVRARCANQD